MKADYNKLDDECALLWQERLLKTQESIVHHRRCSPGDAVPATFGFNAKAYLDSIDHAVEIQPSTEGFISRKEKQLTKDEKLELHVKRVLLAKDVLDGKGYGRRDKDPSIGYFGIDDLDIARSLIV